MEKFNLNSKKVAFWGLATLLLLGIAIFWFHRQAVFSKEILHLEIAAPEEAAVGQEIVYIVKYKNNGNFTLEKPKLEFELPDNSLNEDNKQLFIQNLKGIEPGQEDFVAFKARLLGREGDMKTAQARLSYIPHNLSARYESDTAYTTKISSVPITMLFATPSHVAAGTMLNYSVNYSSDIDYPLENMSLKIDPVSGFLVTSSDPVSLDKIEWKLPTIKKSKDGQVSIAGTVSPNAPNTLNFSAKLGMWQNGTFVVVKEATKSITVDNSLGPVVQPSATLSIDQKVFRANQGGFENSGPIPPQVGKATTYIVNWQVRNNDKAVSNVAVRATLPSNVTIGDEVSPDTEASNISFDSRSHQIIWSHGVLPPQSSLSLTFQITLTPDVSQKGTFASLIDVATATGQDQATGIAIQGIAPAVNTSLPNDRSNSGEGTVQ